jgi:hypothetical protein
MEQSGWAGCSAESDTHGRARSGVGREGEVSSWLIFTPVKTKSTKDNHKSDKEHQRQPQVGYGAGLCNSGAVECKKNDQRS